MKNGIAVFALDVRGFGSWMKAKGHEDVDFDSCLEDVKGALESIHSAYPNLPVFLLGESMGGAIALRAASLYPELVDGLVSSVPAAERFKQGKTSLKVFVKMFGGPNRKFDIGSDIVAQATQNEELRDEWKNDPLGRMELSPKELVQFQKFMNENHESAKKIVDMPVLFVQGTRDKLVKPEGTWELFNQVKTGDKVFIALPSEHLIFEEAQTQDAELRAQNLKMVASWLSTKLGLTSRRRLRFAGAPANTRSGFNVGVASASAADTPIAKAMSLIASGQSSRGVEILDEIQARENLAPQDLIELGDAYAKSGKANVAREQYVRALRGGSAEKSRRANQLLLSLLNGTARGTVGGAGVNRTVGGRTIGSAEINGIQKQLNSVSSGSGTVFIFMADWCEQCKDLDQTLGRLRTLFGGRVNFEKVDVSKDTSGALIEQFNVGPIPTAVFVKRDGTVSDTVIGDCGFANYLRATARLLGLGNRR